MSSESLVLCYRVSEDSNNNVGNVNKVVVQKIKSRKLLLWSMACLSVNSRKIIKGFEEYEDDKLIRQYYLQEEAGTTLELKENNLPIASVESVEGGIRLTALVKLSDKYFSSSECEGRNATVELRRTLTSLVS